MRYACRVKVVRHTETELVVQESTFWLAALTGAAVPFLVYGTIVTGQKGTLIAAGVFLFFAFLSLSKITVVFDSVRRIADWKRFRYLRTWTASIPFDEIKDIVLQSSLSNQGGRSTYRLAILTAQGSRPFSEGYGSNRDIYTSTRTEILQFLKPGTTPAPAQE